MKSPLVSICCITYNHKDYIRDAIKGFLMQKTNFPFEIIIHDDASTDDTAEIIEEYAEKYPESIISISQQENQYSKGIRPSLTYVWPRARGKYIALCEGDDYWTDPLKLQKQIDLLEMHPEYALCFHEAYKYYLDTGKKERFKIPRSKNVFTTSDLILRPWFVPTASIVFRKKYLPENYPEWYLSSAVGDIPLMLYLSKHGRLYCIRDIMSVYRIGAPFGFTKKMKKNHSPYVNRFLNLLEESNKQYFENKYTLQVKARKFRSFVGKIKFLLLKKWLKL